MFYWNFIRQSFVFREEKTEGIEVKSSPVKTSPPASPEARPVERQVEARNPEDSISSMVRCLYFASTYISDGKSLECMFYHSNSYLVILVSNLSVLYFR